MVTCSLNASYNISLVYHVHFIYYICLLNNKICMNFVVLYVLISVQYEQTHKIIHLSMYSSLEVEEEKACVPRLFMVLASLMSAVYSSYYLLRQQYLRQHYSP